jgi:hypothetical protein
MGDWQTADGHRTQVVDDLVVIEPHGHLNAHQIAWLFDDIIAPVILAHGLAYVVLDARQATPADPESRRVISRWVRAHPGQTLFAVFGASRAASAVGTLLINALRLLTGRVIQLKMFAQSGEALSWLHAQRDRRRVGLPFEL